MNSRAVASSLAERMCICIFVAICLLSCTRAATSNIPDAMQSAGYPGYEHAMAASEIKANDHLWNMLVDVCRELGIEGHLQWAARAGHRAFWVCTIGWSGAEGAEAGQRALIEQDASKDSWTIIEHGYWIN